MALTRRILIFSALIFIIVVILNYKRLSLYVTLMSLDEKTCPINTSNSAAIRFNICDERDEGDQIYMLVSSSLDPEIYMKSEVSHYNGPFKASLQTLASCPHTRKRVKASIWEIRFPLQDC